jgi:Methyltransferase domain
MENSIAITHIEFDHAQNPHTLQGANAAFSEIFSSSSKPKSLLDVGCGIGTWMRAAIDLGVADVCGLDGVILPEDVLHVPSYTIERYDLSKPFKLGRRFEVVLCLEVAEHLPEASAAELIWSITEHTDNALFSAACPGQPGQNHINCQWPSYWQHQFNRQGFRCEDAVRWQIWDDVRIEPWYRQNIFWARRDPAVAGQEARIKSVIHPELQKIMNKPAISEEMQGLEKGLQSLKWYFGIVPKSTFLKIVRRAISTRHGLK